MSVVAAVRRDLARLPPELSESALAASALALGEELDGDTSAAQKSMCAKALLDTMDRLRELAPEEHMEDRLDELTARRARRRKRLAKP